MIMKMTPGMYLTFKLANNSYGVALKEVREINRMMENSGVPDAPAYVAGIINLRGKVLQVIDLKTRLNMAKSDNTKETCIIVVEGQNLSVGVIVDSVQAVVQLTEDQIDDSPINADGESFIKGVGKFENNLIMLIDMKQCLSKNKLHLVDDQQSAA